MALSLPAQLADVAPEEKYEVSRVAQNNFIYIYFFGRLSVLATPLLMSPILL